MWQDVTYPAHMSDCFRSFLRGLLTKRPEHRLGWPALMHHPFISGAATPRRSLRLPSHARRLRDENPHLFLSVLPREGMRSDGSFRGSESSGSAGSRSSASWRPGGSAGLAGPAAAAAAATAAAADRAAREPVREEGPSAPQQPSQPQQPAAACSSGTCSSGRRSPAVRRRS